jgi:hypothetical protein
MEVSCSRLRPGILSYSLFVLTRSYTCNDVGHLDKTQTEEGYLIVYLPLVVHDLLFLVFVCVTTKIDRNRSSLKKNIEKTSFVPLFTQCGSGDPVPWVVDDLSCFSIFLKRVRTRSTKVVWTKHIFFQTRILNFHRFRFRFPFRRIRLGKTYSKQHIYPRISSFLF